MPWYICALQERKQVPIQTSSNRWEWETLNWLRPGWLDPLRDTEISSMGQIKPSIVVRWQHVGVSLLFLFWFVVLTNFCWYYFGVEAFQGGKKFKPCISYGMLGKDFNFSLPGFLNTQLDRDLMGTGKKQMRSISISSAVKILSC